MSRSDRVNEQAGEIEPRVYRKKTTIRAPKKQQIINGDSDSIIPVESVSAEQRIDRTLCVLPQPTEPGE